MFPTLFVFLNCKVMKKIKTTIGVDISKLKLDVCVITNPESNQHLHFIVPNSVKGIMELFKKINLTKSSIDDTIVCFEHTGVYAMHLCFVLQQKGIKYAMVPAIEIKRAKGLTRGKSDKADAKDIAFYAITHLHKIQLTTLPDVDLMKLKLLLTERDKVIKAIALFTATTENVTYLPKDILQTTLKTNKKTIAFLQKALKEVETNIDELIKQNNEIKKQMQLATSVPGIGKQTAIQLIVTTRNFTAFENSRQLACYCGVAPFPYSSGSSIKGKTKVNHMANKKLKSVLNMAALAAKKYDTEIKQFYERKVNEGKNKMSVLNAVRNKLLTRVVAVINRGTPFVNTQKFIA